MQIAYVDGPRLRRSLVAACAYAQQQRGELNRINVFPVPDGDTGTNLSLTVQAIADRMRGNRERSVSVVARDAAQAAVLGARGNCGMILSHFLLGFSDHVGNRQRITAAEFGDALDAGVRHLHSALERPVEGTILTVMRDTAAAAEDSGIPDFVPLVGHLVERARDSLRRTPSLLPALRKAGVVDAGAKGFVSLLEGVLLFIHGDPIVAVEPSGDSSGLAAARVAWGGEEETYRYCTEALVRGDALPDQASVRADLGHRGDSLIVIRAGDVLKIHIHTDDPDEVFDYLRNVGRLETHKAEDMRVQHEAMERAAGGHVSLARRPVSIVTDSASDLPDTVARAHGIHVTPLVLVDGDQGTLRDRIDISAEEFHERLKEDPDELPTTSQPAPADFMETFARAAEDGEQILAVLLGSTLSGTFASAEAAARRFHGAPVHLVDSLGASLLQGLMTLKGAEMAEAGASVPEIAAELRRVRARSGILLTVDSLDRLLASGRVGRGRALLGSVLNVKPIMWVDPEGKVQPVAKALGRSRVVPGMMKVLEEKVGDARKVRFGVVHVGIPEIVPRVLSGIAERWGRDAEVLTGPATPVISTHIGLGGWGLAYLVED